MTQNGPLTITIFCLLIFRNCPKKGAKGDAVDIVNALKVFFKYPVINVISNLGIFNLNYIPYSQGRI